MNITELLGGVVKIAQISLDNAWKVGHMVGFNEGRGQAFTEGFNAGYEQAQKELSVHRLEKELT